MTKSGSFSVGWGHTVARSRCFFFNKLTKEVSRLFLAKRHISPVGAFRGKFVPIYGFLAAPLRAQFVYVTADLEV